MRNGKNMSQPNLIVFDLDGVLINASRGKEIYLTHKRENPEEAIFHYENGGYCYLDTEISDGATALNELLDRGYSLIYLTGRRVSAKEATLKSMQNMNYPVNSCCLFMKPSKEDDTVKFKEIMLRQYQDDYNIIAFVDDKESNRKAGDNLDIPTYETVEELLQAIEEER